MRKDLKAFLLRGNVVDLAVAVVIGAAFTAIVTAVVEQLINPLIALVVGQSDLSGLDLVVGEGATTFGIGAVVGAIINFLLIGVVLFLIVKAINRLQDAMRDETSDAVPPEQTPEEIVLLRAIRDRLGPPPVVEGQNDVPPPPAP